MIGPAQDAGMSRRSRLEKQRRAGRVARSDRPGKDRGWDLRSMDVVASDAPVGPDVEVPGLDELNEALRAFDRGLPWPLVRPRLLPLFESVRPYPAGMPDPLRSLVPTGV